MSHKAKTASAGMAHGGRNGKYKTNTYYNAPAENKQPIMSPNGRVIGTLSSHTFHKNVKGSKHMLRKPPAWAIDTDVLTELGKLGTTQVTITDTETETTYTAPLSRFEKHGLHLNRGFGPQLALPLGYWSIDGKPPYNGGASKPDPTTPRQLPLFAEV